MATIYVFNLAGVPVTADRMSDKGCHLTFPPEFNLVQGFAVEYVVGGENLCRFVETYITFQVPKWWS